MADDINPTQTGPIDLRTANGATAPSGTASGAQPAANSNAGNAGGSATQTTTQTPAGNQPAAAQPRGARTATATDPANPASKLDIPDMVKQQYPDLVPLIIKTESMTDEERQYWFQILPIMTEEQIVKLREILDNEKSQLAQLDQEYDQEVKKINDKHTSQWKSFEAAEKRKKLQEEEAKTEQTEKSTEEDLLKKLQDV